MVVRSLENRIAPSLVFTGTMRAAALVLTHEMGEIDLTVPRTDAEVLIVASARAGIDRRYRLAGLLLGNAADAEDATQEAMLRAWRSAASLRDFSRVDAWLDGILVNVCRDRMRRRKLVRFIVLADGATGPALDPFQAVVDRDEVARAMRGLDADQRIVVVLHYWAGVTLEGVADRLGWPLGTVKSRLHRALQQMRASLEGASVPAEDAR